MRSGLMHGPDRLILEHGAHPTEVGNGVDAFHERLAPRLGEGIDRMTIYTMSRDWELDDSCMGIYRKSLLYLIRNALEPERSQIVLGAATDGTVRTDASQGEGLFESILSDVVRSLGGNPAPSRDWEPVSGSDR